MLDQLKDKYGHNKPNRFPTNNASSIRTHLLQVPRLTISTASSNKEPAKDEFKGKHAPIPDDRREALLALTKQKGAFSKILWHLPRNPFTKPTEKTSTETKDKLTEKSLFNLSAILESLSTSEILALVASQSTPPQSVTSELSHDDSFERIGSDFGVRSLPETMPNSLRPSQLNSPHFSRVPSHTLLPLIESAAEQSAETEVD